MTFGKPIGREPDHLGFIRTQLTDLRGYATLANELIQNADDAPEATYISFDVRDEALVVDNDGVFSDCSAVESAECLWLEAREKRHMCDFHRFRTLASGDKRLQEATSGAFGIGFIAVYQVSDHPEIISSGRHWVLFDEKPSGERIQPCQGCAACQDRSIPGTRFILPWASDGASLLRRALQVEAITPEDRDTIIRNLLEYVPSAMLFLRKINKIAIKQNGNPVKIYQRISEENCIYISDGESSNDRLWHLCHGDFAAEADEIRASYPEKIERKRSAKVTIAVPSAEFSRGVFCAFLPTQQYTGLPFHINADFYPKSDRKGIVLEQDFRSVWNREAIAAGAKILAQNLEPLGVKVGPVQLWRIIEATNAVYKEAETERCDRALKTFWVRVAEKASTAKVFYSAAQKWMSRSTVCLLGEREEEEAVPLLTALGISTLHEDLRPFRNLFRLEGIGVKALDLLTLVRKLYECGLDNKCQPSALPTVLASRPQQVLLWKEISRLYSRVRKEDLERAKEMLWECAIAPATDGSLCLCERIFCDDDETVQLFKRWDEELDFVDNSQTAFAPLKSLCNPFTLFAAIDSIKTLLARSSPIVPVKVIYDWLEARRGSIVKDKEIRQMVAALPIFPTKTGYKPLPLLALPGDFTDPIGISDLLEVSRLDGKTDFVTELGIKRLTLLAYVRDLVPQAFASGTVELNQKREVVALLASRLGEFKDDGQICHRLQLLQIIECESGVWHKPKEAYFHAEEVVALLGSEMPMARFEAGHELALRDFYSWIGVAAEPREDDVLAKIHALSDSTPSPSSRDWVQKVIAFYGKKSLNGVNLVSTIDVLKRLRWIPAQKNLHKYFKPSDVYATFRQYLFSTANVKFLDIDRRIENKYIDFLELCGINMEPEVEHVLQHVIHCIDSRNTKMNREVYTYLSSQADDRAIAQLKNKACLLIGDEFVKPSYVFWNQHYFGPYRFTLGSDFRKYGDLLDRLGVRQEPEYVDARDVLVECSNRFAPECALDDKAYEIYLACWRLIQSEFLQEKVEKSELLSLAAQRLVCNYQRRLRRADALFFDDRIGLAAKLGETLKNLLIPRIIGVCEAQEAAGVRSLSESTSVELVECREPLPDDNIPQTFHERRGPLMRVLGSEIREPNTVSAILEKLSTLNVFSTAELKGKMAVNVDGRTLSGPTEDLPVVYQKQDNVLYYCRTDAAIPWPLVARELSLALCPQVEPGRLASALKDVFTASDEAGAQKILDELGFSPLLYVEPRVEPMVEPVREFGGSTDDEPIEQEPEISSTPHPLPHVVGIQEAIGIIMGGNVPVPNAPPPGLNKGERAPSADEKEKKWVGKVKVHSYFAGGSASDERDTGDQRERSATDQAGIEKVVQYETSQGRRPVVKPHTHPGYDIESKDADGAIARYIEVKSLSRDWDSLNAELTKKQFDRALELGVNYWLYVVENAQGSDTQIHCIQDPARVVSKFAYDGGWKDYAN